MHLKMSSRDHNWLHSISVLLSGAYFLSLNERLTNYITKIQGFRGPYDKISLINIEAFPKNVGERNNVAMFFFFLNRQEKQVTPSKDAKLA